MYTGPTIIKDGLIFYFDAANSKSLPTMEYWLYLSDNKNIGTLYNNPVFETNNMGSLLLDGTSYISIPDSPNLNLTTFTYSSWIRNTSDFLNWNRLVSKKINYTDFNGYEICLETGNSANIYISGSNSTFAIINSNIKWTEYTWHNVVVIFDHELVTLYCDGNYIHSDTISEIISNTNPLLLGKISGESSTQWIGNMAIVSMYDRILSSSEIKYNYDNLKKRFI